MKEFASAPEMQIASQAGMQPAENKSHLFRYQKIMAYLFLTPTLLLFLIFVVLPAFMALFLSFTNYDIISRLHWVGWENYSRLFSDDIFYKTLKNGLVYTVVYVPLMISLSLVLALALNRKVPGMKIFRTIYYLPMITSSVAAATVWTWLLQKDYGLVNQVLGLFGIVGPAWLANSDTAMLAVVVVTNWQGMGGNIILYLAGLQGVPTFLYEAAMLDGANAWQIFRYVTWPSLRNTTFFITTMTLIGSFQLFDQAYVMTNGGPGQATLFPVFYIWQMGFQRLRMGYASALAFELFILILIISLINMRINRENTLI